MAERLGMSVARAQSEISSAEYVMWIAFSALQDKKTNKVFDQKRRGKKVMTSKETYSVFNAFKTAHNAAHKAAHPGLYQ